METGAGSASTRQPDVLQPATENRCRENGPRGQIVARSAAMRAVLDLASGAARFDFPVLIVGEAGAGKQLVARFIHRQSRRSDGPFVRVACGSLAESEVEEKLFGGAGWQPAATCGRSHRTAERRPPALLAADRGTLFLDEVSRLPGWAQTRLVDVLQPRGGPGRGGRDKGVPDVRLIASAACDLQDAASHRCFNARLYHYLNVIRIDVPPLRRRHEDIQPLAQHFLHLIASALGWPDPAARRFSPEAWACLPGYDWPGNAPELAGVVTRAAVLAHGAEIGPECVKAALGEMPWCRGAETVSVPLAGGLMAMEGAVVQEVIRRCGGNKAAAARALQLHRRTLYRILKKTKPR